MQVEEVFLAGSHYWNCLDKFAGYRNEFGHLTRLVDNCWINPRPAKDPRVVPTFPPPHFSDSIPPLQVNSFVCACMCLYLRRRRSEDICLMSLLRLKRRGMGVLEREKGFFARMSVCLSVCLTSKSLTKWKLNEHCITYCQPVYKEEKKREEEEEEADSSQLLRRAIFLVDKSTIAK